MSENDSRTESSPSQCYSAGQTIATNEENLKAIPINA